MNKKEDLRGVFFIIKGHYTKGARPSFTSDSGSTLYIGGFNPSNDTTEEWYMLLDKDHLVCVACGDLNTVTQGVYKQIVGHRTLKHYNKWASNTTQTPPVMVSLYREIYDHYGDYFEDLVVEQEDLAYEYLANRGKHTPVVRHLAVEKTTPVKNISKGVSLPASRKTLAKTTIIKKSL